MTETMMKGRRRRPALCPSLCTRRTTATSRSSGRKGEHEDEDEKEQEEQQDWEQYSGDSGDVPPNRQSDVLLPTSPIEGLEFDADRLCVNIKDVIFFRVDGQRDTASGPEYLCVGEVWLRADTGILLDLLRNYRRKVAREHRLATLRIRKRTRREVGLVEATGGSAQKKAKQA